MERSVVLLLWGLLLFYFQEAQYKFCFKIQRTPLLGTRFWLGWSCSCIFGHIMFEPVAV